MGGLFLAWGIDSAFLVQRRGEALSCSQESERRQNFHSKNKLNLMLKGEIKTEKGCKVWGQN